MRKIYDAIIIGSGAAAYGVADWLYKENIKNIAIVTENRLSGTSRNTGSDKQTYYKLSLDGKTPDSPYKMAQDIAAGGSCDGIKAYQQAMGSVKCFLRLCEYGVGFPTDEFGGYPGYKTDHDNTSRATSVGPLTSKFMTEKLENAVLGRNKTELLDNRQVIEILTENNRTAGVVVLNAETQQTEIICAKNVIAATGAPACIYEKSVYPESQHGMTGVLIDVGVSLCNYSQWQYGMASTDFRWNVSGSFMQVIPRLVSVDSDGTEREFLSDYFENIDEAYSLVFFKGYQWPFSFDRMTMSSAIDMSVHSEIQKNRDVYLDYTKNPKDFCFENLCDEAKEYIEKTECFAETPIARLEKLNSKAIAVYARQNIDLYTEKLKIAVCAQHNNGGVHTDRNYQSDIEGLFVIGEAAGSFGLARPGGSALNDTQTSGLAVSRYIKKSIKEYDFYETAENAEKRYSEILKNFVVDDSIDYSEIKTQMSKYCSFLRDREKCEELLVRISNLLENYPFRHKSISQYFYDKDMLISAKALLETVINEMKLTGSRGGAVFFDNGNAVSENVSYRKYVTVTKNGKISFEEVSPIPEVNEAFEKYLGRITENQ